MSEDTTPLGSREPSCDDPFPGEFHLERWLGGGAYGEVWLARDLSPLARLVALKFLRLSDPKRAEQALALLRNEARLLASLRHPNIVQIHAWKHAPAAPCLVLQYVSGGSLHDLVSRDGPLSWQTAARYIADVADGLLLVHGKGIIHRDLKPANMLLDPDSDEAMLTDFGIAARLVDPATAAGTPRFMAPEAHLGEVSPALDVYGLAASLFWLITATPPFDGTDVESLCASIERGLATDDARFAGIPAPLEALIRAGLDADPTRRPTLAALVRDLRGSLNMLLADRLAGVSAELQLVVSRQVDAATCVPVATTRGESAFVTRDLKRVPAVPDRVELRTGDRVRIDVRAAQAGYITVFNIGPTGNLNLLYPAAPGQAQPQPAHQCLPIVDVVLTPPAGKERLFAVWTRSPLPLRLEELRSLVERGDAPASGAYRATRDMVRVGQSLDAVPADERRSIVVELDHQ